MSNLLSLEKGSTINLNKQNSTLSLQKGIHDSLTKLHVGLGWDVHNDVDADLDAFILQVDQSGNVFDTIYYGQLKSKDRSILHTGDNLTGEGDGDDEVIKIDLQSLNPKTKQLLVAVNVYQARIPFSQIDNAFVRIENDTSKVELARYNLSKDKGKNYSLVFGSIVKNEDGTWDFKALGDISNDRSIQEVRNSYERKMKGQGLSFANPNQVEQSNQAAQPQKKGFFSRLFGGN